MSVEDRIEKFLGDAGDWEKLETDIGGVSVVKMPATKSRPALLSVEVNPLKDGKPMKRKGLFITSAEMLLEFSDILTDEPLLTLMKSVDAINATQQPDTPKRKKLKLKE